MTIKLALIGVGQWGKHYLETASAIPVCRIVSVCAKNNKTLEPYVSKYATTTDYHTLISKSDIDGFIVATPAITHAAIVTDLIAAGKPILVEKPITASFEDALLLQEKAKKVPIMVGHIYRYHSAFEALLQNISAVGQIVHIEAQSGNFGPFREDISPLWDWAPHDVAMAIFITKKLPKTVAAWSDTNRTQFYLKLAYKTFNVIIVTGSLTPVRRRLLTVIGKRGSLVFDDTQQGALRLFSDIIPFDRKRIYKTKPTITEIAYANNKKPLQKELERFIEVIRNKLHPPTDLVHALAVIKILTAAEQSLSNNGQTVIL